MRALDPTRYVTSGLPLLFEQLFDEGGDVGNAQAVAYASAPTDLASDRWGDLTEGFCKVLDVVGYNYLCQRYAWDAERFFERVVAGTETFPLQAFETWRETEAHPNVIGDFVWTSWDYLGESGIGKVDVDATEEAFLGVYPYHLANCGDLDICGWKRPQSHYRDLLWGLRTEPWIGVIALELHGRELTYNRWGWEPVLDSWTYPGDEGKLVTIYVYSVDDEVELLVNGVSQGRQPAGENDPAQGGVRGRGLPAWRACGRGILPRRRDEPRPA